MCFIDVKCIAEWDLGKIQVYSGKKADFGRKKNPLQDDCKGFSMRVKRDVIPFFMMPK